MDETGARVACPKGEEVVIPIHIKELYTLSPENHKFLIIIETIYTDRREPLSPFIICPGKQIMENWIHDNLKDNKVITNLLTGYTNNDIIM